MLTRFLVGTVPLACFAGVGWWLRGWLRPARPGGWAAHIAPDGYEMQVVTVVGCIQWQRFTNRGARDDQAGSWCLVDHAVLVRDPGYGWRVVWGEEALDGWESVWPAHG